MMRTLIISLLCYFVLHVNSFAQICLTGTCKQKKTKHGRYDAELTDELIRDNSRPLAVWDATAIDSILLTIGKIQQPIIDLTSADGSDADTTDYSNLFPTLNQGDQSPFVNSLVNA